MEGNLIGVTIRKLYNIMESGGVGGVLSLSFKLLIRLGNDKHLLRPYEGLIKLY